MQESTKKTWDIWEIIAIKYLQKHWYTIIDTNFKFWRFWEIDIIAKQDNITVFFEVKYRISIKYGIPEESLTKYKLSKCKKTVEYFCKKNRIDFEKIRFDAITIIKWDDSYRVKHYRNIEI